jgi:hypothetical protein
VIRRLASTFLVVSLAAVTAACGSGDDEAAGSSPQSDGGAARSTSGGELIGPADEGVEGVLAYRVDSNDHTEDALDYELSPPVGGDHFPVPATCGFYEADTAPPDELVVHDLEHGAVWIAYDPGLDEAQLAMLRDLVAQQAKVTATPVDGLGSPVVLSAWARQLPLDTVDDPRVAQFIETYRNSANAPEPTAACQGAGEPAVPSPTA